MASSWYCMWFCGTTRPFPGSWLSSSANSLWNISSTWWTPATTPQWRCCGSGTGCLKDSTALRSTMQLWRLTCLVMNIRTSQRTWRTSCPLYRRVCVQTATAQPVSWSSSRLQSTSGILHTGNVIHWCYKEILVLLLPVWPINQITTGAQHHLRMN